jgi:acyl carrier protein
LNKSYISVPIGKPFSNTKAYIVDSFMRPVPIGVQGELLLAGDGLARGYLNRKELTETSFINNPFEKEGKVYKTGDLTRWLPDGEIEYLGRIDEQVKIRGFRIETGEIEAEIVKSNLISQVIVTAKKDKKGVDYLVAYVVATENYTKEAVITHLRRSLPEYMLPTFWVELPAFPRTASGKINRKALPEPNFGENFLNEYVAPVSNVEIALCKIWEELLQVETIGIRDNFFERGGHSLLVIRLLAMVKREFKIELKISAFFELPTVEELAKFIEISQNVAPLEMENYDSIKL